jgi:hypothetical protein
MRILALLLLLVLPACAHLGLGSAPRERAELWKEAHQAFEAADFVRASLIFADLAQRFSETLEGRESHFYLGAIRLDPRNAEWDPRPAERWLSLYLAQEEPEAVSVYRRPEAQVLLQLAQQLNMPPQERVPGLQPEVVEREVEREVPRRVVVPAQESRALAGEVERLRGQVAERDATIRQQREELERIRRTLTRPTP